MKKLLKTLLVLPLLAGSALMSHATDRADLAASDGGIPQFRLFDEAVEALTANHMQNPEQTLMAYLTNITGRQIETREAAGRALHQVLRDAQRRVMVAEGSADSQLSAVVTDALQGRVPPAAAASTSTPVEFSMEDAPPSPRQEAPSSGGLRGGTVAAPSAAPSSVVSGGLRGAGGLRAAAPAATLAQQSGTVDEVYGQLPPSASGLRGATGLRGGTVAAPSAAPSSVVGGGLRGATGGLRGAPASVAQQEDVEASFVEQLPASSGGLRGATGLRGGTVAAPSAAPSSVVSGGLRGAGGLRAAAPAATLAQQSGTVDEVYGQLPPSASGLRGASSGLRGAPAQQSAPTGLRGGLRGGF